MASWQSDPVVADWQRDPVVEDWRHDPVVASERHQGELPAVPVYPEGSPGYQDIQKARPLPIRSAPSMFAAGPDLLEAITPDLPQPQYPDIPERPKEAPKTAPEAYDEAGGDLGGILNALDFVKSQPVIAPDQADQIVGAMTTPARLAATLIGKRPQEKGMEQELSSQVSGFSTPESLAMIALFKSPVARMAFAGQMGAQAFHDVHDVQNAWNSGDGQALGRALTAATTHGTIAALLGKEPLAPKTPKPVERVAPEAPEDVSAVNRAFRFAENRPGQQTPPAPVDMSGLGPGKYQSAGTPQAPAPPPPAPPEPPKAPAPMSVADQIRNAQDWQRGLQNEALQLGNQANLLRKMGQPIPKPLADRIAQINEQLRRGYQPPEPNASNVTGPEGLPSQQVRPGVVKGAPLQQQGKAPPVRPPQKGNGQSPSGGTQPRVEFVPRETTDPLQQKIEIANRELQAAQAPVETPITEQPVPVGPSNRLFEKLRAAGQLPEIKPGVGKTARQLIREGEIALKQGKDAWAIVSKFLKTRSISPREFGVLRAKLKELYTDSVALERNARLNPSTEAVEAHNAAYRRFADFARNVIQPTKTMASDLFRAMQEESNIDISQGNMADLTYTFEEMHKRPPTPKEIKGLQTASDRIQKANVEREQMINEIDKALKQAAPRARKLNNLDQVRASVADIFKKNFPC